MNNERLLSAREAALWLQVNPRTAQLRARRALRSGDSAVRTIAGAYVAPDWWWQKTLAKPIKVGRPRKNEPYERIKQGSLLLGLVDTQPSPEE